MDGPGRDLLDGIAPYADLPVPDLTRIGDALVEFSNDHDYLVARIERIRDVSGPIGSTCPRRVSDPCSLIAARAR
jgi:hypothetical protein